MKLFYKHVLTCLLALGLGASALAADMNMCDQAGPGYGRSRGMGMMDGQDGTKLTERMQQRMNQRHAALHDKLKLNAEQEAAWKAFIAGATPPAIGMRMNREEMVKLSAPERMEKMLGFMKDREARMMARLVELKKFYAVLTPEQQKIFDAESNPRRRHGWVRNKK
jgi:periplasmic protein CpxP/Spy